MDASEVAGSIRIKVEGHVLGKLQFRYPHVIPAVLSSEASAIEITAFAKAKSRGEYLCIISSYCHIHDHRKNIGSDSYRVPRLTAQEEVARVAKFVDLMNVDFASVHRNTQAAATTEYLLETQGAIQQNLQQAGQQLIQPIVHPNVHPGMPEMMQATFQQNLQQQQAMQQQMHFMQQLQANVNAQSINPGMAATNAQNFGMNIINGAQVQQPMQNVPHNMIPPNIANPAAFPYLYPQLSQQGVGFQFPNALGHSQQLLAQQNFVDPRLMAQAAANPALAQNQVMAPQALAVPQMFQNTPVVSEAQGIAQQAAGNVLDPAVPHGTNDSQYTDEMITELARQTAQQHAAHQVAAARIARGQYHTARGGRQRQRERMIAPNAVVPSQPETQPQLPIDKKSQLVAKWINLQREYRPRIDRIKDVLNLILQNPNSVQKRVIDEVVQLKQVLRASVEKLMGDQFSESAYIKASARLAHVVQKYKKLEEMDWAEVRMLVRSYAKTQLRGTAQQTSVAQGQLRATGRVTMLQGASASNPSSAHRSTRGLAASQGSRRSAAKTGKMTVQNARNQLSNSALAQIQQQQLRTARIRQLVAAGAVQQETRPSAIQRTASLPSANISQQAMQNLRRTNSAFQGATGQESGFVNGVARGQATSADAARQAALALKAGNAAMAAARAHYNPRKRTATQSGLGNHTNKAPLQKKPTESQARDAVRRSGATSIPKVNANTALPQSKRGKLPHVSRQEQLAKAQQVTQAKAATKAIQAQVAVPVLRPQVTESVAQPRAAKQVKESNLAKQLLQPKVTKKVMEPKMTKKLMPQMVTKQAVQPLAAQQVIQPHAKEPSTNVLHSKRVQEVVTEHVRSSVMQHVRKQVEAAMSAPMVTSAGSSTSKASELGPTSTVTNQQSPSQQQTDSKTPGMLEASGSIQHPEGVEQPGTRMKVASVAHKEPSQSDDPQQIVSIEDPLLPDFPLDEDLDLPRLSSDLEIQPSSTALQGHEPEKNTGTDLAAGKGVDRSAEDNIEKQRSPDGIIKSIKESQMHLNKVVSEDPVFVQGLAEVHFFEEQEGGTEAARIEAALDGKKLPGTSIKVKETLKHLEKKQEQRETAPKPKPKQTKKLTLIEQVKEESEAFEKGCDFMKCEVHEEYKKPVVLCKCSIQDILIPGLVLRVFKGYPSIGTVTYAFERPPMGWCHPLDEMRYIFRNSVTSFNSTCRVQDVLEAWKSAIDTVRQRKVG